MKTQLLMACCALICASAASQTTISGNVYDGSGGPLTLAGSPYLVPAYATLTVPAGQTLTVEPGVVVRLRESATVDIFGMLVAEGDSANRIRFIADTTTQRWYTFIFRAGSINSLKYCDIENGGRAIFGQGQQLLLQNPASLTIDNTVITGGEDEGIYGQMGIGAPGTLIVTNSTVSNNGGNGIELTKGASATLTLSNNNLTSNGLSAYRLEPNIYPSGGTVSGNGFDGIELSGGNVTLSGVYEMNLSVIAHASINVTSGTTVTINPGIKVRMNSGASWDINGTLTAEGVSGNRILFTSNTPGQRWLCFILRSGSYSSFKYCDIEQGGYLSYEQILLQDPASITIDNCNITQGGGDGLGGLIGSGLPGTLSVTNSNISNNGGFGVDLLTYANATTVFYGNTLISNYASAYRLSPNNYPENSTVSGNGFDGIELTGGTANVSGIYELSLLVNAQSTINVASGTTVTVTPGAEVRMKDGATWEVSGTLIAEGTLTDRIHFTTNTTGERWNALLFRAGSSGSFKFCDIDFGGKFGFPQINLQDPLNLLFEECIIANSGGAGVNAIIGSSFPGMLNINNCIFTNNSLDAINLIEYGQGSVTIECNIISGNGGDGIRINDGSASVQYNYISSNAGNGLTNAGSSNITATHNWWGDSSGPGGLGTGSGDEVANTGSGSINFSSWATVPSFVQCGDTFASGTPYITSLLNPDTLLHGGIENFIIYGGNFDTAATVTLTRGTRGVPDPGDIHGVIKTLTSNLIIAEFDLTNYDIIADWDLVIQNPDSSFAKDTLFFIPSIIAIGGELTGTVGYPVVPPGQERSNYLQIANIGNDGGVVLLQITPPPSELINLKIESKTNPEWDRETETDKSTAYLLVFLAEREVKTLKLFWGVDPGNVVYPPSHGAFKTSALKQREDENKLVFGSDHYCSYKGVKGATRAQVKGLIIGSLVTAGCGALTDALLQDPNLTNLKKAVDNVVDGLPNGIAKTPKWVMEQVANELLNLIPGVGWAQIIGGCINQILTGFFSAMDNAAKGAADRLRASTNGTALHAFERALEQMDKNGRSTYFGFHALTKSNGIFDQLHRPPCNPSPAWEYATTGPIRGPFDPNDKTTSGNFINGIQTNGDTMMIHMIPFSELSEPIKYTIFFENKAQATDSAINVTITDTLDASFDLSTLEVDSSLSLFSRGSFSWSLSGNILTIHYDSIMLPPNVNPPDGEWQAAFRIKLLPNRAAGTVIRNRASIVFDFNPPILTPEVIHIVGSPEITAVPAIVDFGTLEVGSMTTESVRLKNAGDYELIVGTYSLNTASFEIASDLCSSAVLQPGDSCEMVIRFNPAYAGAISDTLAITSSDISNYPLEIALKGDAVTGMINEAEKISVRLRPNPATDELTISFDEMKLYHFIITDFIGAKVLQSSVNSYVTKIDLKKLRHGVYFIFVTDEDGNSVYRKFVKI